MSRREGRVTCFAAEEPGLPGERAAPRFAPIAPRRRSSIISASSSTGSGPCHRRPPPRFVAASQPSAGSWLDMPPDGSQGTRIDTPDFRVAVQYHLGLNISEATAAQDVLAAKGERVDRKGDEFANKGEHNRRHGAALAAVADAERAVATGPVILGDKENLTKTNMFNEGHVVDIAIPGDPDACLEIKVPSPLTATHHCGGGAHPPDVGDRFGFGNTEEYYRIMTLGCKARGRDRDPPFDPVTGKGRVVEVRGHYRDALLVKRNRVVVWLVECFGGIAPEPFARLRRHARLYRTILGLRL